jgi:hypothetical protein
MTPAQFSILRDDRMEKTDYETNLSAESNQARPAARISKTDVDQSRAEGDQPEKSQRKASLKRLIDP